MVVAGCSVLGLGFGWWVTQQPSPQTVAKTQPSSADAEVSQTSKTESESTEAPTPNFKMGSAYWCRGIPPFVNNLELQQPVAIDTRQSRYPGVMIRELRGSQSYRHESWAQTGAVGPTVMDQSGNVYVIPVPSISLDINPVAKNQTIYRIDGQTGVMEPYLTLPKVANAPVLHPYGVIGLGMDCDTNSLYVSSVYGSDPKTQRGAVYLIDLNLRKVTDVLRDVDSIGLGVFNFPHEKRLYFGSARDSNVFSMALMPDGRFTDETARFEYSLAVLPEGDTTSAKKIRFARARTGRHEMLVDETEFGFRLTAQSTRTFKKYRFALDGNTGRWEYSGLASGD